MATVSSIVQLGQWLQVEGSTSSHVADGHAIKVGIQSFARLIIQAISSGRALQEVISRMGDPETEKCEWPVLTVQTIPLSRYKYESLMSKPVCGLSRHRAS